MVNNNNDNKEGKEGEQRRRRRTKEEKKGGGGEKGGKGKLLRMGRGRQDDIEASIEVLADVKSCLMDV